MKWRATALYGAQWRRRRQRCRNDNVIQRALMEVQKRVHHLLRRQAAACGVFSIAHIPEDS